MESTTETSSLIEKNKDSLNKAPSLIVSVRFLLVFLIFLFAAIQCMQKVNMGISIVCMITTNSSYVPSSTNQTDDICLFTMSNQTSETNGEFDWSKKQQGFLLSSYFYGYILTQIPGGWLSYRYGGKKILCLAMLLGSLLTMLVPLTARLSYLFLIICRLITGLAHGMVWPAVNDIFVRWIPESEKSRLIGFASAGSKIGNIIALPLGSYLCLNGFDNGWPSIFYIYGLIGIVSCILFITLTSNSPLDHKFISKTERDFIIRTTSIDKNLKSIQSKTKRKQNKTPWLQILTSKACIAIYFVQFSSNWGNYLFLTQLPTFMSEILKFDIQSNGLFSALPYLTGWICAIGSSQISDILIQSKLLRRNSVRKIFTAFAMYTPMIATLILAFVDCNNPYLAVALLMIGVGFLGISTGAGFIININEVGGVYSGVLFGVSNTFGTLPGILAPYIVSILTSNKLQSEWKVVFILTSIIYLIGGTAFILLSEAEVQSWALNSSKNEDDEDTDE